jgi:hypothetical protein
MVRAEVRSLYGCGAAGAFTPLPRFHPIFDCGSLMPSLEHICQEKDWFYCINCLNMARGHPYLFNQQNGPTGDHA